MRKFTIILQRKALFSPIDLHKSWDKETFPLPDNILSPWRHGGVSLTLLHIFSSQLFIFSRLDDPAGEKQ